MIRGFTCGAFDLLHPGHLHLFEQAKQQCDYLIVGLHSDPHIDRAHKRSPIQSLFERWTQLSAVEYVDEIIPYDSEADLLNLLATVNIHRRFLGSDYQHANYTGESLCRMRDIDIIYIPRLHTFSSTNLYERVRCGAPSSSTVTE